MAQDEQDARSRSGKGREGVTPRPDDEVAHPETPGPQPTADDRTLADAGLVGASESSLGVGEGGAPDPVPERDDNAEPRRERR